MRIYGHLRLGMHVRIHMCRRGACAWGIRVRRNAHIVWRCDCIGMRAVRQRPHARIIGIGRTGRQLREPLEVRNGWQGRPLLLRWLRRRVVDGGGGVVLWRRAGREGGSHRGRWHRLCGGR